jgi:hypothetical protein
MLLRPVPVRSAIASNEAASDPAPQRTGRARHQGSPHPAADRATVLAWAVGAHILVKFAFFAMPYRRRRAALDRAYGNRLSATESSDRVLLLVVAEAVILFLARARRQLSHRDLDRRDLDPDLLSPLPRAASARAGAHPAGRPDQAHVLCHPGEPLAPVASDRRPERPRLASFIALIAQ